MNEPVRRYRWAQAAKRFGTDESFIRHSIEEEWLRCGDELDDEDMSRLHLILELIRDLGVNEPAVPIILHLMDQLHGLHRELVRRRSAA